MVELRRPLNRKQITQAGSVLILALLVMAAVMSLGVMYLEVSASYLDAQARAEARLQARALAEGALDIGLRRLVDEPTFRGTIGSGEQSYGSYEIVVSNSGSNVLVTANASTGTVGSSQWSAQAEPVGLVDAKSITVAMAGSSMLLRRGSNVTFDAPIAVGSSVTLQHSSVLSAPQISEGVSYDPVVIDIDAYRTLADVVHTGQTTLPAGNYSGIIYCDSRLTFEGAVTVEGVVVSPSQIVFDAGGAAAILGSAGGGLTVLSGTSIEFKDMGQLDFHGSVAAQNTLIFSGIAKLQGLGSLIAGAGIDFDTVQGTWLFDSDLANNLPAEISGGPSGSTPSSYSELWRRPF